MPILSKRATAFKGRKLTLGQAEGLTFPRERLVVSRAG